MKHAREGKREKKKLNDGERGKIQNNRNDEKTQ